MKKREWLGYLIVAVFVLLGGIFDNYHKGFPISMLKLAFFSSGSIIYLISGSLNGYGLTERRIYEKYGEDHRSQMEKDLYPKFNLKGFLILLLIPIVYILFELVTYRG